MPKGRSAARAAEELRGAIEREKSRFIARNLDRCGYLRVQLDGEEGARPRSITANFTLDGTRRWHSVEIALPDSFATDQVEQAFTRLEEGIGAARVARLFGPRDASSWLEPDGHP